MRILNLGFSLLASGVLALTLSSCASVGTSNNHTTASNQRQAPTVSKNYASRLPSHINTGGQKTIVVDPRVHAWGAYDSSGSLVKAGLATAGGSWCPDIGRSCKTSSGTFHIQSLGSASCKSTRYPRPNGGAPMPYCMFFNGNMGLHGSPNVFDGNGSHGCVRLSYNDAAWIRHNFANVGTKVIVRPY